MLKPCPFCGREPELVEADIGDPGDSFTKWNVFCPTGAPQCWITPQTGFMLSERAAIAAWNLRADEESIRRETIEECAKLCEVQVQRPAGYHGAWEGYGASMGDKTGTECAIAIRALSERNSRGSESVNL